MFHNMVSGGGRETGLPDTSGGVGSVGIQYEPKGMMGVSEEAMNYRRQDDLLQAQHDEGY